MEKNYNVYRKPLRLPEYGRHIHEMVDKLRRIENRDERNRQARVVIGVMGNLFPMLRDSPDFRHKLWDHLFLMAGFDLDVDSPYPVPTHQGLNPEPARMPYPDKRVAQKHYGKLVPRAIRSLIGVRDAEAVRRTVAGLACYMRTKSYEYNQDHPSNEVIIKDIKRMSENRIEVDEVALNNLKSEYKQPFMARAKKNVYKKKNNRGQRTAFRPRK